jgi:amino acid permease
MSRELKDILLVGLLLLFGLLNILILFRARNSDKITRHLAGVALSLFMGIAAALYLSS